MSEDYFRPLGTTRWKNPTTQVLRVRIWDPINRRRAVEVFQPGEVRTLPSSLDRAIQKVRHGKICGGLAPQLQRVNGPVLPIEPAIDSEASARRAAADKVRAAQALRATADAQLVEAAVLTAQATAEAAVEPAPEKPKPEAAQKAAEPEPAPARQSEPEQRRDDRGSQHQNRR